MNPDFMNGCFELLGSLAIWGNVYSLFKDKSVKGVNLISMTFFFSWGLWNLYYYPHLGQWWSFIGGISIVLANAVWLAMVFIYKSTQEATQKCQKVTKNVSE